MKIGETLPDGTIQSHYTGICYKCGESIKVNYQGSLLEHHKCKSEPLEREQDTGNCNWDYLRSR